MIIDPKLMRGRQAYQLFISCIIPRPIAFVSSVSQEGLYNAAPFSFFTGISAKPPLLCFSPARKRGGDKKDTWKNAEATGDFVVNVANESITQEMNICGTDYPEEINEFEAAGLTPIASQRVQSPRIKESPIQMECELVKVVEFEQTSSALIVGEVVIYHLDNEVLTESSTEETPVVDPTRLKPLGRLGGSKYSRVHDEFELARILYRE